MLVDVATPSIFFDEIYFSYFEISKEFLGIQNKFDPNPEGIPY